MAVSFVILLFSMKCFWKTSAAPPAPIVVTAPQYSHTTSARPADGFIGRPHELDLKFCGVAGRAAGWARARGVHGGPRRLLASGPPGDGGGDRGAGPFCAPRNLTDTEPSG